MFEKEATEYARNNTSYYGTDDCYDTDTEKVEQAFNGAAFGYNKANEWQYVSEKGTPQKEGHYLVCLRNKDKDIFDCWIYYDKDVGWYSMKVRMKDIYAWKEIVPPSEPMRSLDKEEQKKYTESISKVYKPTCVKLFDKESE